MSLNEQILVNKARFELIWATKQVDNGKENRIRAYNVAHEIISALWMSTNYLGASAECAAILRALTDSALHQMLRN